MKSALPRLARIARSIRWSAFGAVFVLTLVALTMGVVTSERPGLGDESWVAWIY